MRNDTERIIEQKQGTRQINADIRCQLFQVVLLKDCLLYTSDAADDQ